MPNKICAHLIDDVTGEKIRQLLYEATEETLTDIMNKAELYVTLENINKSHPIRITVKYV